MRISIASLLLLAVPVAIIAGCGNPGTKKVEKKEIGVQLYSIRSLIGNDKGAEFKDLLKELADMGYTAVEAAGYADGKLYGLTPEEYKAAVTEAGLKPLSSHVSHGLTDEQLESGDFSEALPWWDQCIAAHKAAGMEYLVTPWMGRQTSLKHLKTYCDYFNAIGRKCADAGLKFGYHNHSYEFEKVEDTVPFDFILENTDPECVFLQMDVFWVVMGQASPVDYFKRYPGRFKTMHIKDDKELGQSGMVGFDAIFENAGTAGLEYIIVEVESYSYDDVMKSMRESAEYLLEAPFVKASYSK